MSVQDLFARLSGPLDPDDLTLHDAILAGFPTEVVDAAVSAGWLDADEVHALILPRRTLAHRRQHRASLSREESERLARVASVMREAIETFGSTEAAHRWLRAAPPVFGGRTPLSLLSTDQGARFVDRILGRIAHGVYS